MFLLYCLPAMKFTRTFRIYYCLNDPPDRNSLVILQAICHKKLHSIFYAMNLNLIETTKLKLPFVNCTLFGLKILQTSNFTRH